MRSIFVSSSLLAVVASGTSGACSVSDQEFWTSYGQDFSNFLAKKGRDAWGSASGATKALMEDPMVQEAGFSQSCAECFGVSIGCGKNECMFACMFNAVAPGCLKCVAESKCTPELYKCTGYGESEMPPQPTVVGPDNNLPVTTKKPEPTTTTTTTTSTTTTTTSTTTTTTSTTTTTTTTTTSAAKSSTEQCTSSDQQFWDSYGIGFSNFLAGCGLVSFGDGPATTRCVLADPMVQAAEFSKPCATCFGDSVLCGRDHCMMECLVSAVDPACLKCVEDAGCNQKLYTCAGFGADQMPPPPSKVDQGSLPEPETTTASPETTTTTSTTASPETTTTTSTTASPETTTTTTSITTSPTGEAKATTAVPTESSTTPSSASSISVGGVVIGAIAAAILS